MPLLKAWLTTAWVCLINCDIIAVTHYCSDTLLQWHITAVTHYCSDTCTCCCTWLKLCDHKLYTAQCCSSEGASTKAENIYMFAIAWGQKFPSNHYLPCDLNTLVENNSSTLLWEDKTEDRICLLLPRICLLLPRYRNFPATITFPVILALLWKITLQHCYGKISMENKTVWQ